MQVDTKLLISMLQWMRPAYSDTEKDFCRTYLQPVFGDPDHHGNYIKVIGKRPAVAYTAHTDTVHKVEGVQTLTIEDDFVTSMTGSCLGADCTTGIWLMLGMIEAGVEGVYVAHAAEEIGGVGSTALVKDNPPWLDDIAACISFDRYGTESIITHQGGSRTASDEFAASLALALDMPFLKPDTGGTYTDSLEYAHIVSECTNLSVGYYNQHSIGESQDLLYSEMLLERLIEADWSLLVYVRDPSVPTAASDYLSSLYTEDEEEVELCAIDDLIFNYPQRVAQLLLGYGFTAENLAEEMGVESDATTIYKDYYQS
jgi:hypothetical protein